MKIHATLHGSRANGPGLRSVIWTQGCQGLSCPGCQNPLTHPVNGGYSITPEELAYRIVRDSADGTEGVTISGGEPMQAGLSVYRFICMIRALKPHWTVGMFTGYTLTELTCGAYDLREPLPTLGTIENARAVFWEYSIKDALHWAITGRYDRTRPAVNVDYSLRPHLRMCSSLNQCLWLFKGRYTYDDFAPAICEMNIGPDGLTQISGFPPLKQPTGE